MTDQELNELTLSNLEDLICGVTLLKAENVLRISVRQDSGYEFVDSEWNRLTLGSL